MSLLEARVCQIRTCGSPAGVDREGPCSPDKAHGSCIGTPEVERAAWSGVALTCRHAGLACGQLAD